MVISLECLTYLGSVIIWSNWLWARSFLLWAERHYHLRKHSGIAVASICLKPESDLVPRTTRREGGEGFCWPSTFMCSNNSTFTHSLADQDNTTLWSREWPPDSLIRPVVSAPHYIHCVMIFHSAAWARQRCVRSYLVGQNLMTQMIAWFSKSSVFCAYFVLWFPN